MFGPVLATNVPFLELRRLAVDIGPLLLGTGAVERTSGDAHYSYLTRGRLQSNFRYHRGPLGVAFQEASIQAPFCLALPSANNT